MKYNEKTNMQWIQFNVVGTKSVFITYVYDYFRCCWVVYTLIHNNRHRHIQSHAIFNTINAKKAIQYQIYCIHILKKWSKFSCKIWLQLFVHGNGKLCRIKCVLVCTKWKTFHVFLSLVKAIIIITVIIRKNGLKTEGYHKYTFDMDWKIAKWNNYMSGKW